MSKAQQFADNGYLHLPSWIPRDECDKLIARMRDLTERKCHDDLSKVFTAGEDRQSMDNFFAESARRISFFFDPNASRETHLPPFQRLNKVGHALHNLCPVYQKFSHQKKFYELMAELGHAKPMLVQSMFIFKQPRFGDEVPPHQDASFLATTPHSVIGLWFALEDATIDNGCLWALPKAHRGPLKNKFMRHESGFRFAHEKRVDWPRENYLPLEAKAGDVIVLHGLLPHFSEKNRSDTTRFAYTLHFIDRSCHYERTNWLDVSSNSRAHQ